MGYRLGYLFVKLGMLEEVRSPSAGAAASHAAVDRPVRADPNCFGLIPRTGLRSSMGFRFAATAEPTVAMSDPSDWGCCRIQVHHPVAIPMIAGGFASDLIASTTIG